MAHRAANGWISPFPSDYDFTVDMGRRSPKLRKPSGIFVHGSPRTVVAMNYAGIEDSALLTFKLPPDPGRLRDLARALQGLADDIENDPYGSRTFSK